MIFIAEIGMNYNGNFELAFELIKKAKESGADIAKFQLGWRDKKDEINYIDKNRLIELKNWCDFFDIEFMVSIITESAFELSKEVDFNSYKIASRTLIDNFDLAKKVVDLDKPTFVSTGMWKEIALPFDRKNVSHLWCLSKYPTRPADLKSLPKDFNNCKWVGYSDHSIGIEIALMAIARGATVIEKHFTLDKSDTTIRDHALSATPKEFELLTKIGRNIERNLKIGI